MVIPFLTFFSDPIYSGRIVSVITGLVTIIGIYIATYLLFKSKRASLLASFIYSISPFSVFFDRMALTDSTLTMFGVWTFVFAVLTAKFLRLDFAMITGFALGGALLTKSPALFFSILIPTTWILSNWPKKQKFTHLIKLGGLFLATYLIGYGMYQILRLGPNYHLLSSRNLDYVDPLKGHLGGILDYFVKIGPMALILLFLAGIYVGLTKYKKETLILLAWGLVPIFVSSEYAKVITARYILFTLPFLVIIASTSVMIRRSLRKAIILFLAVFVMQSFLVDKDLLTKVQAANLPQGERSGYLEEWTSGYGIKEIADFIKEKSEENKDRVIIVGTEGYFGTLPEGLQIYFDKDSQVVIKGVGLGFDSIPQSLVESKESGNLTYLVINASRLNIPNFEEKGLELVAAYPKAFRKEGSREFNLYGPRDALYLLEVK
jgi:hypothetical protein